MAPKKKAKTKVKKKVIKRRYRPTVHPHLAKMLNHYAILNRPRDDSLNNLLYAERRSEHHLQQAFREQDQRIQQAHHKIHTKMNAMVKQAQDQHKANESSFYAAQADHRKEVENQQTEFMKTMMHVQTENQANMSYELEQIKLRSHQRQADQDNIGDQTARLVQRMKEEQQAINVAVTPLQLARKRDRKTLVPLGGSPRNLTAELVN